MAKGRKGKDLEGRQEEKTTIWKGEGRERKGFCREKGGIGKDLDEKR